jgi:ligand-binding sensor domain-containing protein
MPYGYGVQAILEDSKGNVWIGLSGGLFRLEGDSIKHISKNKGW